ncbi:hypothetical protein CUN61_17300 [Pseudomonas arsenicoxydans]|uniref:Uncharacterized protein n=1 Tax=Pseudomonas arsenicoxydans TaxID=702115 RepID=A0A4P6G7S7_9PSED|nr:hypothetical protein CUN61_17300 [Pseudomonas arsenicoxydans]
MQRNVSQRRLDTVRYMPQIPVGVSLLAIAVCHITLMSTDTAQSRAGSLPQGDSVGLEGCELSSLQTAARGPRTKLTARRTSLIALFNPHDHRPEVNASTLLASGP